MLFSFCSVVICKEEMKTCFSGEKFLSFWVKRAVPNFGRYESDIIKESRIIASLYNLGLIEVNKFIALKFNCLDYFLPLGIYLSYM
jgi:hypothetical protein